jgi:hypothetical protein
MLLKVGVAMIAFALTLAGVVAGIVVSRSEPSAARLVAAEAAALETSAAASASGPVPQPAAPAPAFTPRGGERAEESPDTSRREQAPRRERHPESRPEQQTRSGQRADLPVEAGGERWPALKESEMDLVTEPRRFDPELGAAMALTIGAIGIYDVPVITSNTRQALDSGVIHVPETDVPWDGDPQKNVYIAGHRLGYPGTGSRLIFYNLDTVESRR